MKQFKRQHFQISLPVLVFWVFLLFFFSSSASAEDFRIQKPGNDFLIIGHMGAPLEEPENTIPSFQKALDLGANAVETDLSLTKDGILVLWHDWDPDTMLARFRQLGKQGLKVRPFAPNLFDSMRKSTHLLTLAELRKHFGYTLRQNPLGTNKRLPQKIVTFEEFCRWATSQSKLEKIFLDVKIPPSQSKFVDPFFKEAGRLLKEHGLVEKSVFLIPNDHILQAAIPIAAPENLQLCFDREIPAVLVIHPTKFSTVEKAFSNHLQWASIGRPVATFLGYKIYLKILTYDQKLLKINAFKNPENHMEGLISWTIDKPEEMKEIIGLGVRGMLTNKPRILKQVVDSLK